MRDSYYTPLELSEIIDRVGSLEKKSKRLLDANFDLKKRIEILEAQFEIQGERVVQPQRYYDPMKKPHESIYHVVDLKNLESKFDETMWKMLEVVATTGAARYPDIERLVREEIPGFVENRLRRAAKALAEMNVLNRKELKLPLTPITILYSLSDIGERIYHDKFKATPVPSEMIRVQKEHDNLDHGYGILELGQLLASSEKYKDVYVFNRTNPIRFTDGTQYIPDVKCVYPDGKGITYFEYERGFHTQKDFNNKCNKMCVATRVLNFVAPNRKSLIKKVYPLVKEWVKKRGICEFVPSIIRLTTSKELQKCHLSKESWLIVFDNGKSLEPIICKVKLDED